MFSLKKISFRKNAEVSLVCFCSASDVKEAAKDDQDSKSNQSKTQPLVKVHTSGTTDDNQIETNSDETKEAPCQIKGVLVLIPAKGLVKS